MGPPDLVIEILSPSNRRHDLGPKKAVYARTGVRELWLVDPDTATVAAYVLKLDAERPAVVWSEADDDVASTLALPCFALPVARIFRCDHP